MPIYKDEERGTWYCCFYYVDWQGLKKRKTKRGFTKQKDAKEYERAFLDKLQSNPQMTFAGLVELYIDDMKNRLRQSTMNNKKHMIDTKILPYFGKIKIGDIKPTTVRQWQNKLIGQDYSETYLKSINNQLCAILNYAVKYYGLRENPCHKAGSMGRKSADEMQFWTREEYLKFSNAIEDKPMAHLAYQILYWCGLRAGELLALTRADIDLTSKELSVNKSYQRIEKQDVITEPKTKKSIRIIAIPNFLCKEIETYMQTLFDKNPSTRLFTVTKYYLHHEMDRGCKISGVKRIRVHDLRHSHASLLIELGFSPLLIAERLGHENIETTLNTYSHLYPHKQTELANTLDTLI
ncbi:MAG: site-specific integrase [Oscillospiraceae bacterium]|nr:site-specific integrase [Oscillospiraceae bacterium]